MSVLLFADDDTFPGALRQEHQSTLRARKRHHGKLHFASSALRMAMTMTMAIPVKLACGHGRLKAAAAHDKLNIASSVG